MPKIEREPYRTIASLRERLDLLHDRDRAPDDDVIAAVSRATELRGANLWVLIFAILIASVGLNVNSTAVIIGAMLISPLMGPIIGAGVGVGTYDLDLIKRALASLVVAVIASVATSVIYFLLTPLTLAQPELIARSTPSIWDVLVAICGGLAGMIAATRKTWSNVIPGVAIATALMPPLCTAGYGIATAQWLFALGALYLFVINSVFIGLTAALVVRMMGFKKKAFVDAKVERRGHRLVATFAFVTIVPSVYLTYRVVRRELTLQAESSFIDHELDFPDTKVLSHEMSMGADGPVLTAVVVGKPLAAATIATAQGHMDRYGMKNTTLIVQNTSVEQEKVDLSGVKASIIQEVFTQREALLRDRDHRIAELERQVQSASSEWGADSTLLAELQVQLPGVRKVSIARARPHYFSEGASQPSAPGIVVIAEVLHAPSTTQLKTIEKWLAIRTKSETAQVIITRQ